MMKKSFKVIVGTAIVALFCLITYVYFNVPGDEISGGQISQHQAM